MAFRIKHGNRLITPHRMTSLIFLLCIQLSPILGGLSQPTNILREEEQPVHHDNGGQILNQNDSEHLNVVAPSPTNPTTTDMTRKIVNRPILILNPTPIWMRYALINCGYLYSCQGRCGKFSKSLEKYPFENSAKCKCDEYCKYFGDCCQDYFGGCKYLNYPTQVEDFARTRPLFSYSDSTTSHESHAEMLLATYGTCETIKYVYDGDMNSKPVWLVSSCPDNFVADSKFDTKHLCESKDVKSLFTHPVSHRWNSALTFKNIYCAFCHGVELRDILFWDVQILGDMFGLQLTWSVDELIQSMVDCDFQCTQTPILPEHTAFRTCHGDDAVRRTHSDLEELPIRSRQSVEAYLCLSYYRPLLFDHVTYANIHCLASEDETYTHALDIELHHCIIGRHSAFATFNSNFRAVMSFANGMFSVKTTETFEDGSERHFEKYDSVRQNDCSFVEEYPWMSFYDTPCTDPYPCSNTQAKLPRKGLEGVELACSVKKYLFTGNRRISSDLRGHLVRVNITIPDDEQSENLRNILVMIDQTFSSVLSKYSDNKTVSTHKLTEIIFTHDFNQSVVQVVMRWTFDDNFITVSRLATLIYKELREPSDSYPNSKLEVSEFTLTNFITNDDLTNGGLCSSGAAIELNNVDLIPYQYKSLLFMEGHYCYLELDQLYFMTSFKEKDSFPTTVDQIYFCREWGLESKCGPLSPPVKPTLIEASTTNDVKAGLEHPNIKVEKPPLPPLNAKPIIDEKTERDLDIFRCFCFSVCIFSQIVKIVFAIHTVKIQKSVAIANMLSSLFLIALLALYIVSQEADAGLDTFAMGISSHFCWLSLAGITFIKICKARNQDMKTSHFVKAISMILLAIGIDLAICAVIEKDEDIPVDIGYSNDTPHIFWLSNTLACSLGLIGLCAATILPSLLFQVINPCSRCGKSDIEDQDPNEMGKFRKIIIDKQPNSDIFIGVMFVIGVIDYYDDHQYLWWTMFDMVSCSLGLWEMIKLVNVVTCRNGADKPTEDTQ